MKKFVLMAILLFGGLGAWAYASRVGNEAGEPAQRYRTEPAGRGAIVAAVSATGTVTATTTVIVGSQLSGQVVEILADHNTEVKAGQVLARLNHDTILARRDAARAELMQARAARQLNEAQAEKVRAELVRAEAQQSDMQAQAQRSGALLADAETTLNRQSNLRARGIATDVAVQSATTARATQAAARLSAEAQIASSQAQIAALQAEAKVVTAQKAASEALIAKAEAVVRQIEVDLSNSDIRSPVDGVVVQRNVELGQTVAASLQAPTLFLVAQNLRRIEVYVNVDEADVGRVKPGQQVDFSVSAYPGRNFTGRVRLVRLGSQTVQNVIIYTTIVEVVNEDMALLPGMTANLRIFTERKPDVLRVPNSALRWQPAGSPRALPAAAAAPQGTSEPADDPAGPFAEPPQGGRAGGPGGPQNQQRPIAGLLEQLRNELQLTPEQMKEAERLGVVMRDAINRTGSDVAARREALRSERQRFNRGLEAVLTSEQQAKFRDLRQRTQARAQGGGGRGGPAGAPGRVHVLDEKGNPKVVSLRLGASDGTFTEVLSGEIKAGDALITGLAANPKAQRSGAGFRFGF